MYLWKYLFEILEIVSFIGHLIEYEKLLVGSFLPFFGCIFILNVL